VCAFAFECLFHPSSQSSWILVALVVSHRGILLGDDCHSANLGRKFLGLCLWCILYAYVFRLSLGLNLLFILSPKNVEEEALPAAKENVKESIK
jgi:hypothetical protein